MLVKSITEQIADMDLSRLKAGVGLTPYEPYSYQWATHNETSKEINGYQAPFIIKAAVSAGKTTLISLLARRARKINWGMMVLSRQGEIVEQDAAEMLNFGVENSIFCASLGRKSTFYPVIVGSEGTVVNALNKRLKDYVPRILAIDECHHVDVDDLVDSQETMVQKKGRAFHPEDTLEKMIDAGRKGYTLIIRELQRRCMEKYGKPLVVIGYTGTDYRGIQPIVNTDMSTPGFWRKVIVDISTEYLVDFGAVVPTDFGTIDEEMTYDLEGFESDGNDGAGDFSDAQLNEMQKRILAQGSMTQKIMLDVVEKTKNRNCVLVTCAGQKHCAEAAAALPPDVSYGIVTDKTSKADRRRMLKEAYDGKLKFIFQVGCLTTGVNVPPWDTIVILRRIGSLTLITQLIGRGMRKLKDYHVELGIVKINNLVLDYAGAMDCLAELYFSPMLEQYQYVKDVRDASYKHCPDCGHQNGEHARRCSNMITQPDGSEARCEYFWKSRVCEDVHGDRGEFIQAGCGVENDIVARFCRGCGARLIDPNKQLDRKNYTQDDFVNVRGFKIEPTKDGAGLAFCYDIGNQGEATFRAWEIFWPGSTNPGARMHWRNNGINKHVLDPKERAALSKIRDAKALMGHIHKFMAPVKVTHRKVENGRKDVITRKVFVDESFDI